MKSIKQWQEEVHEVAKSKGWWDGELSELTPIRMLAALANIHCEVSETTECIKRGDYKKVSEELADIIIRVLDFAEACGLNIEKAIIDKNEYNKTRPYRHGNKTV